VIRLGGRPYLECSSRGDRRFSAFCAMVDGRSIEARYQAFKIFADGRTGLSWKEAKGRQAVNATEAARHYEQLWCMYIFEHPELLSILKAASGLSDIFGQAGHVCQAEVLWRIRNGDL